MSNEFKSWEEMTTLEQYACIYWDLYKDAYGIRPRGMDTSTWTEDDFRFEFQNLQTVIEDNERQRREDQARAVVKFCKRIEETIRTGAGDRETALRWIHEADGTHGDDEYLCYLNGLPYGFFRKSA